MQWPLHPIPPLEGEAVRTTPRGGLVTPLMMRQDGLFIGELFLSGITLPRNLAVRWSARDVLRAAQLEDLGLVWLVWYRVIPVDL